MTINWGERVALVGPNGAGKSTLFRVILNQEDPDSGTAEVDEYAITGYLAQEAGDPGAETILEIAIGITPEVANAIKVMREAENGGDTDSKEYAEAQDTFDLANGYSLEPKAKKILSGLGFKQEQMNEPANTFSGGWIMRANLARLLVQEPDLLMLDEPTNHLDLLSLIWLQRYLTNYPGIDRVQEFVDKFRGVGSKASQVNERMKTIQKLKDKLVKPLAPRKVFKFNFPQPPRSNQIVAELSKVKQAYGDKVIYDGLDLTVERGDRLVLVGPNGAGKSTLMKIIAGHLEIQGGEVNVGYATKMGYFSQHRK